MPIPTTRNARSETISQDRTDKNPAKTDTIPDFLHGRRSPEIAPSVRRRRLGALRRDERGA
ncbi:MAG: hypothetical protein ACYCST_09265, partial [Acidimicrobiales bacterium]